MNSHCIKKTQTLLLALLLFASCSNSNTQSSQKKENTPAQKQLIIEGWSFETPQGGELGEEYGVKPVYGILDNYFDIRIGEGFSIAIKIVNVETGKCIRYVFVPENKTITISQIPQGRYYLKLAYGKDWMEVVDNGNIKGKFTRNPFYEKSASSYDFGKKNSQGLINYTLEINVKDGTMEHDFETVSISEEEFYEDLNNIY